MGSGSVGLLTAASQARARRQSRPAFRARDLGKVLTCAIAGFLASLRAVKSTPPMRQGIAADKRLALTHARGLLDEHLDRLRALPAHGNTRVHADQLALGRLLSFFEPMAQSLRLVEACGDFGGRLDLRRLARSTTSDALAAFDPEHLRPLVQDLRARRPGLANADPDLAGITRRIVAADGTYLTTPADVAWALHHTKTDRRTQGQVRANVQLDVAGWVPQVVSVSGDDGESKPAAFAPDLRQGSSRRRRRRVHWRASTDRPAARRRRSPAH
jgi:hypothetical protein